MGAFSLEAARSVSALRWSGEDGARVEPHGQVRVLRSNAGGRWDGVVVETVTTRGWGLDGAIAVDHVVAVRSGGHGLIVDEGGEPVPWDRGGLWIVPAGSRVTRHHPGVAIWSYAAITVERARRTLGREPRFEPASHVADASVEWILRALLVEQRAESESGPRFIEALVAALLVGLERRLAVPERGSAGLDAATLERLTASVDGELNATWRVPELAATVGLSPAHFAREFKRATGITPHAFVLERRLERARLLVAEGLPIAAIADECGFCDQAHLSRRFKRRFRATPSRYHER